MNLEDSLNMEKIIPITLIFIILFIGLIGFIIGFSLGTYNQETVLLNEIKIRDMNLSDRLCIYNNMTRDLAMYSDNERAKHLNETKMVCVNYYNNTCGGL